MYRVKENNYSFKNIQLNQNQSPKISLRQNTFYNQTPTSKSPNLLSFYKNKPKDLYTNNNIYTNLNTHQSNSNSYPYNNSEKLNSRNLQKFEFLQTSPRQHSIYFF